MNRRVRSLLLWLVFIPLGVSAQRVNRFIDALSRQIPLAADVSVSRSDAAGAGDWAVELFSWPRNADNKIAPADYLVEWHGIDGTDSTRCFAALTADAHYSYNGHRFTENSSKRGHLTPDLARRAGFAYLNPSFLAAELRDRITLNDSAICSTAVLSDDGPDHKRLTVSVFTLPDSALVEEIVCNVVPQTMRLVSMEQRRSPGTPRESVLRAVYTPKRSIIPNSGIIEGRHSDLMALFAGDNLSPSSFVGFTLPPFTLPAANGGRYTFEPRYETLIVVFDDRKMEAEDVAREVRDGLASTPRGRQVATLFIASSRWAEAMRASEAPSGHERFLLDGESFLKRVGGRELPLLILVDDYGTVLSTASGENFTLSSIVKEMVENQ